MYVFLLKKQIFYRPYPGPLLVYIFKRYCRVFFYSYTTLAEMALLALKDLMANKVTSSGFQPDLMLEIITGLRV